MTNKNICAICIICGSIVSAIFGCSTVTCPMVTVVKCNYIFYNTNGQAAALADTLNVNIQKTAYLYHYQKAGYKDTTFTQPVKAFVDNGYTETVTSYRKDTTLVNKLINGTKMSIAMSYYNKVDTLVLRYGLIYLPDTIFLSHDSYTHVETPECGSYRFHRLTDVRCTNRGIDHIEITNPTVNYEGAENIRIYFNNYTE